MSFSSLCTHGNMERVDSNFIRCRGCGESFINQKQQTHTDRMAEYAEQNDFQMYDFDRNFDNKYVPKSEWEMLHGKMKKSKGNASLEYMGGYTTYTDHDGKTEILVENQPQENFNSGARPQYKIRINGEWTSMNGHELKKYLGRVGAVKY